MTVRTVVQPPFVVDTEAELSNAWPDGCIAFCKDTQILYELIDGAWVVLNDRTRVFNSVTRPINGAAFKVSTTRDAFVNYSVQIAVSITLSGGASGYIALEISPNNSTWTEVARYTNSNTGTVVVGINTTDTGSGNLNTLVEKNYWVRMRSITTAGTPVFTYLLGREILL